MPGVVTSDSYIYIEHSGTNFYIPSKDLPTGQYSLEQLYIKQTDVSEN